MQSVGGVPQIRVDQHSASQKKGDKWWKHKKSMGKEREVGRTFQPITMDIPTGGLEDFSSENLQFSKRGSVMWGAQKKPNTAEHAPNSHLRPTPSTRRIKSNPSLRVKAQQQKLLSVDEEMLSQKVRSYYEVGTDALIEGDDHSSISQINPAIWEGSTVAPEGTSATSVSRTTSHTDVRSVSSAKSHDTRQRSGSGFKRENTELAGGFEDWNEVQNADVDRYGFIIHKSSTLPESNSGIQRSPTVDGHALQRVSTSLLLAAETPRRKHTIKRQTSTAKSTRSLARTTTSKNSLQTGRPASSQSSYNGNLAGNHSRLRAYSNKLPHNRGRKLMDEAGDMLTLPPGLAEAPTDGSAAPSDSPQMKRKEWAREEKWKKMAKKVSNDTYGGGMRFEFDMHNPKLIERTWKGIPDRWRATAWQAFLASSARNKEGSASDEELIQSYSDYQEQSSPEDVQIDIDVPRTVGSHIMFRRRYRGGQRLLFRVLHAMSIHFPETGYVQGMATLAATLLAYYDEEHAFVMLVRLWELRGLEQLYKHGFAGLMEALDDFEKGWLRNGEVAVKLNALGIPPTAYGTRWYLTLFNYSIPFSAQLRVWDVFMLLGDASFDSPTLPVNGEKKSIFGSTLDVLHAASAALIAGTKDILLESDFENGMKVLTSWIPIRDEDLFMRVAKAEWKVHKRKGVGVTA
ncbi:putative tbc domain [Phaeomoniella chlamydospora]|uniref:Putative tbc domain n=1 Tax=Phaeomoniella chlamydospora TaxID=158046 RepID=A0A0G2ES36_PHACM|nr:putative tbc domain [Phaeomoniella chlamydospora]